MSTRAVPLALLTGGVLTGLLAATLAPASAQAEPVPGRGNVFYLSGAYNTDGQAQAVTEFGDPGDTVYFGDWDGDGVDLPMVRRGNTYYVPSGEDGPGAADDTVFAYGNANDVVLVGDWDGDGVDSLAVRRGNHFLVKNDNRTTGTADTEFAYGDAGDTVLVGNWNGQRVAPAAGKPGKGDTLIVRRGGQYFVKNSLTTGKADYSFYFGNPGDTILVGDWNQHIGVSQTENRLESGDGADQLAVRRGNQYFLSSELAVAQAALPYVPVPNLVTGDQFTYGDPGDAVFVAALPTPVDANGDVTDDYDNPARFIEADGFGVRRSE